MKKILSIDGGGIRGIIPARFLAALEAKVGPCAKVFDLIAGTSTGGIIAVGLSRPHDSNGLGYSAAQLVELYQTRGKDIFSRPVSYELETSFGASGPKYPATGIENVLAQYFGPTKLGQALTPVMVTSYDTNEPGPRFFKSWNDKDVLMKDAARATSAAPTYFDPLLSGSSRYIDGGVVANNPTLAAWVASSEIFDGDQDIYVISIGTGNTEKKEDPKGWGLVRWAPLLIDVFMDGNSDLVHENVTEVFGTINKGKPDHYFRFQIDLGSVTSSMDDASPQTINALLALADRMVAEKMELINHLASILGTEA
jgi:uncharacterized protein